LPHFVTQIWPDLYLGTTHFLDHRIIHLMKLLASATIKWLYSSVLPLYRPCLPIFGFIFETEMNFVFVVTVTLNKLAIMPLDRSAAICN